MRLEGKTIALGICGGIAAYRACDLIRECYRQGAAKVIPVLSNNAGEFITPLTLQSLSGQTALTSDLSIDTDGTPTHIKLAQEADIFIIMPATVNMIGKMANGLSNCLVSTTFMTFTDKPVLIIPAMNTRMWEHPIFQENLDKLRALSFVEILEPTSGLLACGETGQGHLASQDEMIRAIYKQLHPHRHLFEGLSAIVTAGGTKEAIDPVRSITNKSSGKMGLALADELSAMGADITLVTTVKSVERDFNIVTVDSARAMKEALDERFDNTNLVVMAAAVSDYTVTNPSDSKIKRNKQENLTLELTSNPDILAGLGKKKAESNSDQILVGFAAESDNLRENALGKIDRKNLNAIVANDISRNDIGFEADTNEVTIFFKDGKELHLPKASKQDIARQILVNIFQECVEGKSQQHTHTDKEISLSEPWMLQS